MSLKSIPLRHRPRVQYAQSSSSPDMPHPLCWEKHDFIRIPPYTSGNTQQYTLQAPAYQEPRGEYLQPRSYKYPNSRLWTVPQHSFPPHVLPRPAIAGPKECFCTAVYGAISFRHQPRSFVPSLSHHLRNIRDAAVTLVRTVT